MTTLTQKFPGFQNYKLVHCRISARIQAPSGPPPSSLYTLLPYRTLLLRILDQQCMKSYTAVFTEVQGTAGQRFAQAGEKHCA